jgi:hypothetical protein
LAKNVLSNVDDIVLAIKKKAAYISDLVETFANRREANLKLDPKKVFGVTTGKIL